MLQHYEAEQTIIGLALQDEACADSVAALPEDTFTTPETKALQKAIKSCLKDHEIANIVSVGSRLTSNVVSVVECGNACIQMAISTAMYGQIETELLDLRRRRALRKICADVVNKIADPSEDVDTFANEITKVANDTGPQRETMNMNRMVMEFIEDLDKKSEMIMTGVAGLDRITGGLQNGMLAILGARPKVGKTALGLSIALHVAQKAGPVLIISLEMKPKEMMQRIISAESDVNLHRIVTKNFRQEDYERMARVYGPLSVVPVEVEQLPTPLQIRRKASAMQRNGGLAMIMVDYIQLMRADEPKKSRYEEVSSISRELKLMAMDLDVPILALTQFNRESEQGGVRRKPSMAEARDSGSIEQDANIFLIQYPPNEPKLGSEIRDYWECCQAMGTEFQLLEIAANRQGPTGIVPLNFDKSHMKFTTLERMENS